MAETLRWNFVGNDEISSLLEKMDRNATKLDKVLDALGNSTTRMGAKMTAAERGVNELGDEMDRAARKAGELDRALSGVAATKLAKGIAGGMTKALDGVPASMSTALIAGAVGAVAAVGPIITTGLMGAVVGGLAVAGVAAGIAGVINNPIVRAAGANLGKEIKADFLSAASVFTDETLAGIKVIRNEWKAMLPDVQAVLETSSGFVVPLAQGVGGMVRETVAGIEYAVQRAEPVMDVLRDDLPALGRELGDTFRVFGDNAESGADALHDILNTTGLILSQTAMWMDVGAKVYDFYKATDFTLFGLAKRFYDTKDGTDAAAEASEDYAAKLREQEEAATAAAKALEELVDTGLDLRRATMGAKEAISEFGDAVARNGTSLNDNTEAGRRNLDVVLDSIDAADRAGKAAEQRALAEGQSAQAAALAGAKVREQWVNALVEAGVKAGYSRTQLEKLVAEMRAADGKRIRMYIDTVETYRPASPARYRGDSEGGYITGSGPKGVDSELRLSAPGEYVLKADAVDRIGVRELDYLNRGGSLEAIRPSSAPVTATPARSAGRGGEQVITMRVIHQYPDGRVIVDQVQRLALGTGDRDLEAVFGLPAAA